MTCKYYDTDFDISAGKIKEEHHSNKHFWYIFVSVLFK